LRLWRNGISTRHLGNRSARAEIIEVIEVHFDHHRGLYGSGSGDAYFNLVEVAMRRAWQAKHHDGARPDDDPGTARRKRTGRVRKTYQPAGYVEAFDDRDDRLDRTLPIGQLSG
jgi:hypothetical protein